MVSVLTANLREFSLIFAFLREFLVYVRHTLTMMKFLTANLHEFSLIFAFLREFLVYVRHTLTVMKFLTANLHEFSLIFCVFTGVFSICTTHLNRDEVFNR